MSKHFDKLYLQVKERYFSRNPEYWPIFRDSGFKQILDFRLADYPLGDDCAYPDSKPLHARLQKALAVPQTSSLPEGSDDLLCYIAALSKNWESPSAVENVVTMSCDPAIYGSMVGILANPNLVYHEYAARAAELEHYVIRQIAELAGYPVQQATGIFTQGGTFCNLYGYLLGIRKSLPQAREYGMGYTHDYRIINSEMATLYRTVNYETFFNFS